MIAARQVVTYDTEVVKANMSELRTSGTFTDRPHSLGCRFEPFVDLDVTAPAFLR